MGPVLGTANWDVGAPEDAVRLSKPLLSFLNSDPSTESGATAVVTQVDGINGISV